MRFVRTPSLFMKLLPSAIWRIPSTEKKIYLSFDDGPVPEATPFVLEELKKVGAQATFFCVGENVNRNKQLFNEIREAGHAVGIHTYNHLNGWKTPHAVYLDNVEQCRSLNDTVLFRAPYGKITRQQYLSLSKLYKIVFWDVVSYDFDPNFSAEDCYRACVRHTRAGSIVVFHDSLKALPKLKKVLPKLLSYWKKEGYIFSKMSD